jgi:hypothetical protein
MAHIDKESGSTHWESSDIPVSVFTRMNGDDHEIEQIRTFSTEMAASHLEKFGTRILHMAIRFEDVNGPRGGRDIACQIHVTLPHSEPVVVERDGETPRQALLAALDSVETSLRRQHHFGSKEKRIARRIRTGQSNFENSDYLAL